MPQPELTERWLIDRGFRFHRMHIDVFVFDPYMLLFNLQPVRDGFALVSEGVQKWVVRTRFEINALLAMLWLEDELERKKP